MKTSTATSATGSQIWTAFDIHDVMITLPPSGATVQGSTMPPPARDWRSTSRRRPERASNSARLHRSATNSDSLTRRARHQRDATGKDQPTRAERTYPSARRHRVDGAVVGVGDEQPVAGVEDHVVQDGVTDLGDYPVGACLGIDADDRSPAEARVQASPRVELDGRGRVLGEPVRHQLPSLGGRSRDRSGRSCPRNGWGE